MFGLIFLRAYCRKMNATLDKKDALNGTITVVIAADDYMPGIDKKITDYRKKATIPGFRVGHAPKAMIEKMFGPNMLLEEINASASKGLYDFIEENKINILGQPILNEETLIDKLEKGLDYTFKFDIGIAPEFDLQVSSADVFTKYVVKVEDKQIDEEVERMRKRFGKLQEVDIAEDNDMIYVKLTELDDDGNAIEAGVSADSVPILTSAVKSEVVKATLIDIEKGNESTVNIFGLFDNDEGEISHALGIQKPTVADLSPNFKMVVNEIKRTTLADINQELFDMAFGKDAVTTEAEMRDRLAKEISSYFDGQAEHLLEHGMTDAIVAKHNITLPDAFLQRWLKDRYADKFNDDNMEEAFKPEANYLKNHLFEEKVLVSNNIKVEEEDIRAAAVEYTKSMFGMYGMSNQLNDELIDSLVEPNLKKDDYRSKMINSAVKKKVNDYIKSVITIENKEISQEEFLKIVEEHNHQHHNHSHEE